MFTDGWMVLVVVVVADVIVFPLVLPATPWMHEVFE